MGILSAKDNIFLFFESNISLAYLFLFPLFTRSLVINAGDRSILPFFLIKMLVQYSFTINFCFLL